MSDAEALETQAVPLAPEAPSDPMAAAREAVSAALTAAGPQRHVLCAALALRLACLGHVSNVRFDVAGGPEAAEAVRSVLEELTGAPAASEPDPSRPPGAPWTVTELASACNVSASYVRKCIKVGALEANRLGRVLRIAAPEARRFAADLGAEPVPLAHHAHHAHAVKETLSGRQGRA